MTALVFAGVVSAASTFAASATCGHADIGKLIARFTAVTPPSTAATTWERPEVAAADAAELKNIDSAFAQCVAHVGEPAEKPFLQTVRVVVRTVLGLNVASAGNPPAGRKIVADALNVARTLERKLADPDDHTRAVQAAAGAQRALALLDRKWPPIAR